MSIYWKRAKKIAVPNTNGEIQIKLKDIISKNNFEKRFSLTIVKLIIIETQIFTVAARKAANSEFNKERTKNISTEKMLAMPL
ncbi:MAG: hypothetical protein CML38_06835 [Rhodobacteraceae bacterium]|nr:MAG: hypothetical protein CML38_06835 [Paracoccaceae bacterium]